MKKDDEELEPKRRAYPMNKDLMKLVPLQNGKKSID
jgi:hypothetical protein